MPPLRTYQIPDPDDNSNIKEASQNLTREVAQNLIDQADEDLFCALGCWRHNHHEPFNEICYLLHQSLEKWLKVAHQMCFEKIPKGSAGHDLKELVEPFQTKPENKSDKPDLSAVMRTLNAEIILTNRQYPNRVRYREDTGSKFGLNAQAYFLRDAVFITRRLVKRWLKARENGG